MKFTFRSGSVSRQLFQGFAWHDFLPFISHFGSSPISLSGESGCGVASRRRKSRWLWWGLGRAGWFPGLEFCRSFPAPTRISAEKKTFHSWHRPELPCETHFLPWRTAGSSSVQGNPENQLPARRGGGGEGASAPSLGLRATRAPRYPTAAEAGRRGRRRRRGAGKAAVALGRHLLLAAAPGAGRRGYCLDRACRALRLRRRRRGRPEPEPRGRAGSMAAPSPGRPSGCPSFRPSLPAFPPRPRALFSSSSRFPAAAPSRPSSFFFPGGGGSPGKRKGWGQAAASSPQELAGPRQGPRLRPAPPRHIHSSERLRGAGRGGRERRERRRKGAGALGSHCLTGRGGNSATAPAARGEEQRAAAAAPRRGRGGLPRASPQPPTAGLEAGASQSPRAGAVRADVCGGRRREAAGGGGPGTGGRGWWPPGVRWWGPLQPRPQRPAAATRLPKVGDSDEVEPGLPGAQLGRPRVSRPPPPRPIEFLCTTVIGSSPTPILRLQVSLSTAALQLPLMARSVCRKPQRQLGEASHAGPCSELARSATQLLRVSASHRWGDKAGPGTGENGPRNCLKIMPLLEEILDTLRYAT